MSLNRNQLIDRFIGNLSNAIVHKILERAIKSNLEISEKYKKEIINSWGIAVSYREKINPSESPLPEKDIELIRERVIRRIKSELNSRISLGYNNIELSSVEKEIDDALKKVNIV